MLKFARFYWRSRWERFYLKNRWHLLLDLTLLVILIILGISLVSLHFYRPTVNWSLFPASQPALNTNQASLKLELTSASSSVDIKNGTILKIKYQNVGSTEIRNAKLSLSSLDNNYSLSKITKLGINQDLEIKDQTIIFPLLKAATSGEAQLNLYFKANNPLERQINWQAKSEYLSGGQVFTETWNLPSLKVMSELVVATRAYYHSPQGDQLGSGPLPPVVGLPTNYWLFVEAASDGDFKDFVFSARLPQGVELTDSRSLLAGDFKYNQASRQIVWKIPEVKNQEASYRLGFEVQFTPSKSQVGKLANLLINSAYFASDVAATVEASGELRNLTTNLDFDRLNQGQGQVSSQ